MLKLKYSLKYLPWLPCKVFRIKSHNGCERAGDLEEATPIMKYLESTSKLTYNQWIAARAETGGLIAGAV